MISANTTIVNNYRVAGFDATPSLATIFEVLEPIQVVIVNGIRYFPDNLQEQPIKMIEWAGFNPNIYLRPMPMV